MVRASILVALLLAGAGTAQASCRPGAGGQTKKTASYVMVMHVGPMEEMYTPAEVKTKHPKSGEVMVGGAMSIGSMKMGKALGHLEVQICSRSTGKVVANAIPSITVEDTAGITAEHVPVAMMTGVGEGMADMHYGNNVSMPAGHTFTVTVALGKERAVFRVRP